MQGAYHPCKRDVANLSTITSTLNFVCLTANITVDAWEPALLQVLGRTTSSPMPDSRWKSDSLLVYSKSLEGIVDSLKVISKGILAALYETCLLTTLCCGMRNGR